MGEPRQYEQATVGGPWRAIVTWGKSDLSSLGFRLERPGLKLEAHGSLITTELLMRLLSGSALFTLLFAAGLRLSPNEVWSALRDWKRLVALVVANFLVVPILTLTVARLFDVPTPLTLAMVLLGAAPFAPVVPVFARLARADLALAAGLTALFPIFCTFLTPWVCRVCMSFLPDSGPLKFQTLSILGTLLATATAPLTLGIAANQLFPGPARRILRPAEVLSEAVGAVSLGFVVVSEFRSILATGAMAVMGMVLLSEVSLLMGYRLGGVDRGARQVTGLGTANRNIALALLVAADSFPGSAVIPGVVTYGLLLIVLGLAHVGFWRWRDGRSFG